MHGFVGAARSHAAHVHAIALAPSAAPACYARRACSLSVARRAHPPMCHARVVRSVNMSSQDIEYSEKYYDDDFEYR